MTNRINRSKARWAVLLCTAVAPLLVREAAAALPEDMELVDVFPKREDIGIADTYYRGTPAKNGKIELDPVNGFFCRCFEAGKRDDRYDHLRKGSLEYGTARWYLWCPAAGAFTATFYMTVPEDEKDHPWTITVGDKTHTPRPEDVYPGEPEKLVPVMIVGETAVTQELKVETSDGTSPQKQILTFTANKPGKVILSFDCTKKSPPEKTLIHRVVLGGPAIAKAHLLYARWRPVGCYTSYCPPKECPRAAMWVFETKSLNFQNSYSPITTAFGYYGSSFRANGRITEGRGLNFSHWIAGASAKEPPPIQRMPRLIGTDYPEGKYGYYGHEGCGISWGGINVYPHGADRAIQAIRQEWEWKEGIGTLVTFYAYVYDETRNRWMLYGVSQEPYGSGTRKPESQGGFKSLSSFVEVTGHFSRQRSGDMQRAVARRGWFYGSDGKWYRAEMAAGKKTHGEYLKEGVLPPIDAARGAIEKITSGDKKLGMTNAYEYYADDYNASGWIVTVTGGMEQTPHGVLLANCEALKRDLKPEPLPEYLGPEKRARLFEAPVTFGQSKASEIGKATATIDYDIKKTGPNSKAILYYGTVDCLTYPYDPDVQVSHPALKIALSKERTWQSRTPEREVKAGIQTFKLEGLKPGTTYYYRLYVEHDEGWCWDFESGSFKTSP